MRCLWDDDASGVSILSLPFFAHLETVIDDRIERAGNEKRWRQACKIAMKRAALSVMWEGRHQPAQICFGRWPVNEKAVVRCFTQAC